MCCVPVVSNSLQPTWLQPARPLCPWDFPGKYTGVGCHFLLQGNLSNPGIEPESPASPALGSRFFTAEPLGKPQRKIKHLENRPPVMGHDHHYLFFSSLYIFLILSFFFFFFWPSRAVCGILWPGIKPKPPGTALVCLVVKNPPAKAGGTDSIPGLALEELNLHATSTEAGALEAVLSN